MLALLSQPDVSTDHGLEQITITLNNSRVGDPIVQCNMEAEAVHVLQGASCVDGWEEGIVRIFLFLGKQHEDKSKRMKGNVSTKQNFKSRSWHWPQSCRTKLDAMGTTI